MDLLRNCFKEFALILSISINANMFISRHNQICISDSSVK